MAGGFDEMEVAAAYGRGMSIPEASRHFGIPRSRVRRIAVAFGVIRSRADGVRGAAAKGLLSHGLGKSRSFSAEHIESIRKARNKWARENAKGTSLRANGYVVFTNGKNKGKLQHRVFAEKAAGRPLQASEVVHHDDENRSNNRDENLVVLSRSEHSRLHRLKEIAEGRERKRDSNGRFY